MNNLETTMTTKELADILCVGESTVKRAVEKLRPLLGEVLHNKQGGYAYSEKQATIIKKEIQKHHNIKKRNIDSVSTELEENEAIANALAILQRRNEMLKKRAEAAEAKLKEQEPKVEFYDTVTQSSDAIDMKEVAKTLNIKGFGRNNLFEFLREKKILDKNNLPYQSYVNQGYFKIVESHYEYPQGCINVNQKTVVFQKGLDFIRRTIKKDGK